MTAMADLGLVTDAPGPAGRAGRAARASTGAGADRPDVGPGGLTGADRVGRGRWPVRRPAFDAVVVGAGPAGSAAALALARAGRSVVLVERGPFPGSKNVYGGVVYGRVLDEIVPRLVGAGPGRALGGAPVDHGDDRDPVAVGRLPVRRRGAPPPTTG